MSSANPDTFLTQLIQAVGSATSEVFGDPVALGLTAGGLAVLSIWFVRFGGFKSLDQIPTRRHRVYPFIPPALLLIWVGLSFAINAIIKMTFQNDLHSVEAQILSYVLNTALEAAMIIIMLILVLFLFARGFKGIGLRFETLASDLQWSFVHLLALYPLIFLGLWIILAYGRFTGGAGFSLDEHQSLELLITTDSPVIRLLVAAFAVLIVPTFEELLFRGFLQSSFSAWTVNPWPAIVAASLLFTILHPWQHQISLFFLSCGLGYAYERSGSLFRPILMHTLFNAMSVAISLLQI